MVSKHWAGEIHIDLVIGHSLASTWEKIFTLHIYFMILRELEEIQSENDEKHLKPLFKRLKQIRVLSDKTHYKCKNIVFSETLWGLRRRLARQISGIKCVI